MLSHGKVRRLRDAEHLPETIKDVAHFQDGVLEFIGQMSEGQRDALLARVEDKADKEEIVSMYDSARIRPVPEWIPEALRPRVENWFQRKWPVEVWNGIQGRTHHYVAWIWYAMVIVVVMTSPYWWRRCHATGQTDTERAGA
jgi:hypothetical protein